MVIFKEQIKLTGKHAEYLQKYTRPRGGDQDIPFEVFSNNKDGSMKTIYLFDTKISLFMVAAMLGILENRKADIDKSSSTTASIFTDALPKNRATLLRIYKHMILAHYDDDDVDVKIKKAFTSNKPEEEVKAGEQEMLSYVRGGLEIVDELFGECKTYEDVCNAFYDLKELISLED